MILHSLELTHVGRFRETVRLGPFAPGLNVLAAPNESGKSTTLHAAARALFDRHSTKSEELKSLQPAGTSLAPRVIVEFETRAGRFRIAKTFLQKPESQLHQLRSGAWELIADADAADQRVQSLLQSSLPGRGATKPEHWGFLGFLWARQGEPAAWPGLDDPDVGQRIRARLARVELDPVIEQLRARLATAAETILTSTGQPRTGGPLRTAEDDLAAERLRGELDARRQALATAQEKLTALAADAATAAEKSLADLRARLDAAHSELSKHEAHLQSLRAGHQRLQSLLKLRELHATAATLARQVTKAEAATAEIAALEAKRATLPTLTPAKLRKLEEQSESVRTLRAQLQALGLTVELTPEHDTTATIDDGSGSALQPIRLSALSPHRLQSPQSLDLHLAGWGRVLIRSGSQEAQTAAADLDAAETALADALQQAGVPTLEAAREAIATRKELDAQHKAAVAVLAPHLGDHDTLDTLRAASATATRRAETLATTLAPTAAEQALSLTDLETTEAARAETVPSAEKALAVFNHQLAKLRTSERAAVQSAQDATKLAGEHESRLCTLETQIKDLTARYPDGLDAAKTAAQLAFAQTEARVVATQAELPPDFEKLPERNRRAAAALQQIADELQARRTDRDQAKAVLQTLGGQGLYSRETELMERRAEAELRRDAARAQGWSARVAHDLIEHRKQAATKAVLTPLENRLTTAFAELTGNATRQVFLDERLQITGIGHTREEAYAFDQLSQGAKEQLLLCLRLAVAQELATDEPQVLILDDVLVNTDLVRQDRILDALGTQADRLQILLLTCHPDRYRGVGQPLLIRE